MRSGWRPVLSLLLRAGSICPMPDRCRGTCDVHDALRRYAGEFCMSSGTETRLRPSTREETADGMLDLVRERGLRLESVFRTHSHGDHIYDLDRAAGGDRGESLDGRGRSVERSCWHLGAGFRFGVFENPQPA